MGVKKRLCLVWLVVLCLCFPFACLLIVVDSDVSIRVSGNTKICLPANLTARRHRANTTRGVLTLRSTRRLARLAPGGST